LTGRGGKVMTLYDEVIVVDDLATFIRRGRRLTGRKVGGNDPDLDGWVFGGG